MAKNKNNSTFQAIRPVKYSEDSNAYIKNYNSKPSKEKSGKFWDDLKCKILPIVKKEIKKHYLKAQSNRCAYCRQQIIVNHNAAWDTDHIINKDEYPQFLFVPENLCLTCKDCNRIKSNKNVLKNPKRKTFPKNPDDYIICHPHFHDYDEHIKIIKEAVLYIPKTEKGVKLIEICGLLRFVLRFANMEYSEDDTDGTIIKLGTELQNAKSPTEKFAIRNMMKSLLEDGIRRDTTKAIESL